jgi:hypothetical protein
MIPLDLVLALLLWLGPGVAMPGGASDEAVGPACSLAAHRAGHTAGGHQAGGQTKLAACGEDGGSIPPSGCGCGSNVCDCGCTR